MNRRIASLATLFAAGAFVASAAPVTSTVRTSSDTLLTQKGCSSDKDKQASCSGSKKADKTEKKDSKDASCSADKKKADTKDKKQAACSADKGKKDAACGKGSCGSAK